MKTPEDEAFDELEKSLQRKVAHGVTDGNKKDAALMLAREALEWENCNDDAGLEQAQRKALAAIDEALEDK